MNNAAIIKEQLIRYRRRQNVLLDPGELQFLYFRAHRRAKLHVACPDSTNQGKMYDLLKKNVAAYGARLYSRRHLLALSDEHLGSGDSTTAWKELGRVAWMPVYL